MSAHGLTSGAIFHRAVLVLTLGAFASGGELEYSLHYQPVTGIRESGITASILVARSLAKEGRLDEALGVTRSSLTQNPGEAKLLCTLGDILFRQADFDGAARAYQSALDIDAGSGRAHWGLGQIDEIRFQRVSARNHLSAAYRLAPLDVDVILSYVEMVGNPQSRATLLRNVQALALRNGDSAKASEAEARLTIEEKLGGRQIGHRESPYRRYAFPLTGYTTNRSEPDGLLLKVRINESKPLRLLVDTGAKGIVVRASAVRQIPLEMLAQSRIQGLGADKARGSEVALARSVSIDDFRLANCVVEVADGALIDGADGVIGTDVFREFLVRLDAGSRILELAPFESGPENTSSFTDPWLGHEARAEAECGERVLHFGHLLLVQAGYGRGASGYFLLDTGSAHSWLSERTPSRATADPSGILQGAQGGVAVSYQTSALTLKLGAAELVDRRPLTADFHQFRDQQGIEIAGAIGYSMISRSLVTINYRDGVVDVESKSR